MSIKIQSLTLTTSRLERLVKFYSLLGLNFEIKSIPKGTEFYLAHLKNVDLMLIEKKQAKTEQITDISLAISVENIEKVYAELIHNGFLAILEPNQISGQKKCIFLDPDGRAIELIQESNN